MEALTASIPKYKCLEEMYKAWWLSFLEQLNGSFNARRERNMDIVRRVKEHIPTSAIEHHKIQLVILRKKSKYIIMTFNKVFIIFSEMVTGRPDVDGSLLCL